MICEKNGCTEDQKNVDWFCGFRVCDTHRNELDELIREWIESED